MDQALCSVKSLATWKYTVCSNLFIPHCCIFSCSFLLFCRKRFCLQLLEELLSCLACWNVPQMCNCDPRFMFKPFKKKKVSHLIYIPRICHLCPLDHIITANLICQRFTYHSTSLWWDCGFRQVRLLAYFLLRWKLRLLSALAKGSRQKRKDERVEPIASQCRMMIVLLNLLCAVNVLGVTLFAWCCVPILWRVRNNLESQLIHSISIWALM